jgi:hypothetical protein
MPGVVVAEDAANGMVCLHLGFCCSRWLSRGYFPDSFLPKMALGNSENQKTEAYY